jgi:hypothetical protein
MARYRLHIACQIDGVVCLAGQIVEQPDDWVGPHRAVATYHQTLAGGESVPGRDEPLFTKLSEEAEHVL